MSSKQKILITGSCAFPLNNLIRKCLYEKNDYTFVSVDKVESIQNFHNIYNNRSHNFYLADVADRHIMDVVFNIERPDIVIHGAITQNINDFPTNTFGTKVLAECANKYKVSKVLYLSKDIVYDDLKNDSDPTWKETDKPNPKTSLGVYVNACEDILAKSELNYSIIRTCNLFGPRQSKRRLIPTVINNLLKKQPTQMFGQGKELREWLFIDDFCSAILLILNQSSNKEIYNISAGAELSNLEVFHKICSEMGGDLNLLKMADDRPKNYFRRALNTDKIKALGWAPQAKFMDSLRKTISWYLNNQWFFKE